MEFYAFARIEMSPIAIQRDVHISNLTELCRSIEKVLAGHASGGDDDGITLGPELAARPADGSLGAAC